MLFTCGAAWFSRDWWLPKVGLRPPQQVSSAAWEGRSDAAAKRADVAIKQLQAPRGPAFANVTAGELLSYLLKEFGAGMHKSVDSVQAAVVGDRVLVRASVVTKDIPREVIGPFGMLLSDRTRVILGGTVRVIQPGMSEMQVKDVLVGGVRVPSAAIPTLLRQLEVGERKSRTAPDGFEFPTPNYIGDVRVANGKITVYKKP